MPLNIELLATEMKEQVQTEFLAAFGQAVMEEERLQVFCHAISTSVINHITANAVTSTPGVQSGPSTRTGTIS